MRIVSWESWLVKVWVIRSIWVEREAFWRVVAEFSRVRAEREVWVVEREE